jgi:cellulose synthase (UDP-forming)
MSVLIRSVTTEGKGAILGCRYMPLTGLDYKPIADLLYANSANWQQRQRSRQVNIGLLKGTIRFLAIAVYQTGRGLGYLLRFGSGKVAKRG